MIGLAQSISQSLVKNAIIWLLFHIVAHAIIIVHKNASALCELSDHSIASPVLRSIDLCRKHFSDPGKLECYGLSLNHIVMLLLEMCSVAFVINYFVCEI